MSAAADSLAFPPSRRPVESIGGGALRLAAPAKINLTLQVGPRREDGFHEIDSVVAKVTLYDDLTLGPRSDGRIALACSGADCGDDEANLALRAARALADGREVGGADIELLKRIPPGAGLGGGSSDAAAVLRGLCRLWGLDVGEAALAAVGASLGSDVPLFFGPATVRVTGRGEHVAPARVHPFHALLFVPGVHCATGRVYQAYDDAGGGEQAPRQPAEMSMTAAPSAWRGLLRNDLGEAAERLEPALGRLRRSIAERTGLPVSITGSGSAMFVLCDSADEAAAAFAALDATLRALCVPVRSNPW